MDDSAREPVLDAATKLFAEKGLAAVSLQEVARSAGINGTVVPELFDNKEGLYAAVLEAQFSLYAARMDAVFDGDDLPTEKIEQFTRALCAVHKQAPFFFPLFYRELLNPSPYFEPIVKKYILHVAYLSDNNIVKGIRKGQFKHGINPANATMFLAGIFHYYFLASRLTGSLLPEPADDEEYLVQALKVFLTGVTQGGA